MNIDAFKQGVIERLQMIYPEKTKSDIEEMINKHRTIEMFKDVIEDA